MKHKHLLIYKLAALMLSLTLCCAALPMPVSAQADGSSSGSSEASGESAESGDPSGDTSDSADLSQPAGSPDLAAPENTSQTEISTGFTVNSTAVYLVNTDSGIVIYQKNADTPMYPASLVKIMTCLLAIENCSDLNATVTSSYTVFDRLWGLNASNAGLYPGEEVRIKDLLYGLMLPSGCDAAGIIAETVGGSEEGFVAMMNQKAKEIGCTSTNFTNSTGLHDPNQYTTARDMYLITAYAMQYDIFTEISTTYSYTMPSTNKNNERVINHTCSIMNPSSSYYSPYIYGIKTGTTDESGRNLVSYASKDAYNYMLITMGAPIYYENGDTIPQNLSFTDALNFYDWAFNDWAVQTIVKTTDVKGQVKVDLCSAKDRVNAVPETEVSRLMLKSIDTTSLQMIPQFTQDTVDAPVQKGQILGTLTIRMADETIATVNLVAAESLEKSPWLAFCRGVAHFFTSPGFWLTLLLLIAGFVAWLFIMRQININRRRKRRAARSRTGSSAGRTRAASRSNTIRKSSNYRGPSTRSGSGQSASRKSPSRSSGNRTSNNQRRPRK